MVIDDFVMPLLLLIQLQGQKHWWYRTKSFMKGTVLELVLDMMKNSSKT